MVSSSNFTTIILVIVALFSCSDSQNEDSQAGHRYELIKVDSIQVDYLGTVNSAEFFNGRGILHDHQKSHLVLFDSSGNVISEKTIPEEGPESLSWIGGMKMYPNGVVVYYNEGIDEDTFLNNGLGERKNFILYPYFDKRILKIHHATTGWSNEVAVPAEVRFFLNITSPEDDIYALRNDDVVGEEQDFVTIYKMRLQKDE